MQGILHHDGAKAFVKAQGPLLTADHVDAVSHALILRVDGQDLEAQVSVVDDGARSLDVQPVEHRLQGEEEDVGAEAGRKAGHEFGKVGVQHALHRFRAVRRLLGGTTPAQEEEDQLLDGGADYVVEDSVKDSGENERPEGQ